MDEMQVKGRSGKHLFCLKIRNFWTGSFFPATSAKFWNSKFRPGSFLNKNSHSYKKHHKWNKGRGHLINYWV